MSQSLINHSPDLKRLRDDGFEIDFKPGYLLLTNIPYVTSQKVVAFGTLVSALDLAGEVTTKPRNHVVMFVGEMPCDERGHPIQQIHNQSRRKKLVDGLVIDHRFSSKPAGGYRDYYQKMTTYASIICAPAQAFDPSVTPQTFKVIETEPGQSVFKYTDTASSRAEISAITEKLAPYSIAIIGLGGTGSYILDLVAKSPVREIHLFDGDGFLQHNAFRAPGAPSLATLNQKPRKTDYFRDIYSEMRHEIHVHDYLQESSANELEEMDFVFLALDNGDGRRIAIDTLEQIGIPFIDVGMGVYEADGSLAGVLRTTTSTNGKREHVRSRVSFSEGLDHEYAQNIQIAELNALNAALAVIKWKKHAGFYIDAEVEFSSFFEIDGNNLINEDQ